MLFICGILTILIGFVYLFTNFAVALLILLGGLVCLFPFIHCRITVTDEYQAQLDSYKKRCQFYDEQLSKVQKRNAEINDVFRRNLTDWQNSASKNRTTLETRLSQTKELLEKLYALDHIYPKYRNLPALTSIYEYFITGRCSSLIGPHGAYNMFEDEVRKDIIISQLNTVIENLDQIKRNQYMLYEQVTQIQRNTLAIEQELKQVKGLTVSLVQLSSLTAYYAAVTARNTEITAAYHILNG